MLRSEVVTWAHRGSDRPCVRRSAAKTDAKNPSRQQRQITQATKLIKMKTRAIATAMRPGYNSELITDHQSLTTYFPFTMRTSPQFA